MARLARFRARRVRGARARRGGEVPDHDQEPAGPGAGEDEAEQEEERFFETGRRRRRLGVARRRRRRDGSGRRRDADGGRDAPRPGRARFVQAGEEGVRERVPTEGGPPRVALEPALQGGRDSEAAGQGWRRVQRRKRRFSHQGVSHAVPVLAVPGSGEEHVRDGVREARGHGPGEEVEGQHPHDRASAYAHRQVAGWRRESRRGGRSEGERRRTRRSRAPRRRRRRKRPPQGVGVQARARQVVRGPVRGVRRRPRLRLRPARHLRGLRDQRAPELLRHPRDPGRRHRVPVRGVRAHRRRGFRDAAVRFVPRRRRSSEAHHHKRAVVPQRVLPVDPGDHRAGRRPHGAHRPDQVDPARALGAAVHGVQAEDGRQDPVRVAGVLPGVSPPVRARRGALHGGVAGRRGRRGPGRGRTARHGLVLPQALSRRRRARQGVGGRGERVQRRTGRGGEEERLRREGRRRRARYQGG